MTFLRAVPSIFGGLLRTLRLALPKIGIGWMFALLAVNFNRVVVADLGVAAVLVLAMTGMHQFLSPFQVVFGRFADRRALFGLRRTPVFLAGSLLASLVFLALPWLALEMSTGSVVATLLGFALFAVFGIGIAASGDAHHALIAETTPSHARGGVMATVWTVLLLSTIATAIAMKVILPEHFDQAAMQRLYNLTPLVVMLSALGLVGIERRLNGEALRAAQARARAALPPGNPLRVAATLLRGNVHVRLFFGFVLVSMLGIFIQDAIREVFGAEVFGMTNKETPALQVTWGSAALLGMALTGALSGWLPFSKKQIALAGGAGTALGLGLLTLAALTHQRALLTPALLVMGGSTGVFNIGALTLMMEMTVDGATGMYMGLWGVAQAFGQGGASLVGGAAKTALIESGAVSAQLGYSALFGLETALMLVAVALLRAVSVAAFRGEEAEAAAPTLETAVA